MTRGMVFTGAVPSMSAFVDCADHIQIQRLAEAARFLGAVEHRNLLHRCGKCGEEVLHGERTVETDLQRPTFSPFVFRYSTASCAASAPEPIITMTRSAVGEPTYSNSLYWRPTTAANLSITFCTISGQAA